METGVCLGFQNIGKSMSDDQMVQEELRLADLAEPLGYDGIWSSEHHFTDYQLTPSPTHFLSYMAGRTSRVKLGTCAIILPWHDPVRVAEEIVMLDSVSRGRMVLGIGRGLGAVEFDGFRVPMAESRERFIESARLVLDGIETGQLTAKGPFYPIPDRELRPNPARSFRNRTFAPAVSPESFDIMADLGVGLMIVVQKPWETVRNDVKKYRAAFQARQHRNPPQSVAVAFVFCDPDAGRARDYAQKYIGGYYQSVLNHYDLSGSHFSKIPSYEYYGKGAQIMSSVGDTEAARFFTDLQVWGTPEQCFEKIMMIRDTIDCGTFVSTFGYANLPYDEAERSMRLFASEVVPRLKAVGAAHDERQAAAS